MSSNISFEELALPKSLLSSLSDLGYESPTPIQAESIPVLLEGHDLVAQAQTGTGKTAAFALPILANIDIDVKKPQAIILTPTRELAIQVAEAFQSYAKHMKGFYVSPIYGGQDYSIQLRALKRGAHVIVGTPGRVMDHLERGTIEVSAFKTVILDEADEMLKMGFIDDIEWILKQIPHQHQRGLFSATIPATIQKIAERYLKNAKKIHIQKSTETVEAIEQYYVEVDRNQKLEVLTRLLEVEDIQGAIIFARTKNETTELEEKLQARGHAVAALNGDMSQSAREKVVSRLRAGTLDIVIATDVASRGIDVERISHVINYDIPHDTESYVHRIGRTGRAGRKGKAILLVTPRERRLLKDIERATRSTIEKIQPPSIHAMAQKRMTNLAQVITSVIEKSKHLGAYKEMVESVMEQSGCSVIDVAAALAYLSQQAKPLPSEEITASGRDSGRSGERSRRGGDTRDRRSEKPRFGGDNKRSSGFKSRGDRDGEFKPRREKSFGDRDGEFKPRREKSFGDRDGEFKPRRERSFGDRDAPFKPRGENTRGDRDGEFKPRREKSFGDRDAPFKPRGENTRGDRDAPFKPRGEKSRSDRDSTFKPRGEKSRAGKDSAFKPRGRKDGDAKPRKAKSNEDGFKKETLSWVKDSLSPSRKKKKS